MPKKLITHSEDFHTDDVFATALLLELFPDAEVIRSRDEAVIATGDIVYDVGKVYDPATGRYDHHQAQAGARSNGIVYSAFGLLWKEYGVTFCEGDQAVAEMIDRQLVMPIDAVDNGQDITQAVFEGVQPFTVNEIVSMLNPLTWTSETEKHDTQFMEAVQFAQFVLRRLRDHARDNLASQQALRDAYTAASDKRIVVMDKQASVRDIAQELPELLYLISPRPNSTWGVLAVSVSPDSFALRKPFPESWRGLPADQLAATTGVGDVIFCHNTGFYAVTTSKEGALALAQKAAAA